MADTGMPRPDIATLQTELARLVTGTRSLFTSPSVSRLEVARKLGLDPRRVQNVESDDWTEDFVIRVAHSHLIANYLAKLANDRGLIDRDRDPIHAACEEIHGLAGRVRGGLIEDFRRERGVILSVVEPDVADPMLRVAFGLHELRAIHGISQEDVAAAAPELSEAALREYEYAIGYSIGDLLRVREVTERFRCPDPAYQYVYDDLGASVDLLYGDRRRVQFLPERRRARVDQLAGRAPSVGPPPSPSPRPLPTEVPAAAAPPHDVLPAIAAAIVTGRNSAGESQRAAAQFLADVFNPSEHRHYLNFIHQFERRGAIDSFDGVYYASLLLRRYGGFSGESSDRLSEFQAALDRRAGELRKKRAAELTAKVGLPETRARTREEIARSVDIAMSLQHARQISCLTLQAVAGAINAELGRDVTSADKLFRLETVPRYNLRQLRVAQWFLAVCRVPEEAVDAGAEAVGEDRERLRRAVLAHLTEWGSRPPRRFRQRGSAGGKTGPRRGITETGYADLIVVREQLEAELAGAGFGVAEFFPHLEGLLTEQEKKIDDARRVELLSGLRLRNSLFPQPAVGPAIDYRRETVLRADIALAISKWRLTRDPPIGQRKLASIGGQYDDGFYRDIRMIEEAAWPDFPPENAIHRMLEALEAPTKLVDEVDERILALHEEIQWRGLRSQQAATAPLHTTSVDEDPLEDLNYGLEIFYWLAAIHLEQSHLRSGRSGDYVASLAGGTSLDEDLLRYLLNPRARAWHPTDTRLAGRDATLAERWEVAGTITRAVTAYAAGDAAPPTGQLGTGRLDEHRLLWQNVGRLTRAHTRLLGEVIDSREPRRESRLRGTLDPARFDNVVGGNGAEEREALLLLLNSWQTTLDATRPAGERDPLDQPPPAPAPTWHSLLQPRPATRVKHPAESAAQPPAPPDIPQPPVQSATPKPSAGPVASSSVDRPNPRADPDGWHTYGWLHRHYREAYGLSPDQVASSLGANPAAVNRMERGEGKKLGLVAANAAALAARVCTGRSTGDLRPLRRAPEGKNGWSYTGQLLGSIRRGLGESVISAAASHDLSLRALESIERGEPTRHSTQLSTLLDFYAELLEQQPSPAPGQNTSGTSAAAARPDGHLHGGPPAPANPPSFRPGDPWPCRPATRDLLRRR